MKSFSIANRAVGEGHPCFLIAEIGLAHEGSLGYAQSFIDAAAKAKVDAVKFQTHIPEAESTDREKFRVPVFPQDKTRYGYWQRTSFSRDEWQHLAKYARERGLIFLSSPFSEAAVDLLLECQAPVWKIASGEVSNVPLIERIAETGLPVLLSSGMSSWEELGRAIDILRARQSPVAILQCTSAYPCPPETWGLNTLGKLMERFQCPVGLSDHSGTVVPSIAAVTLGAKFLEFHITFHRGMFGPDVSSSLTMEQTTELVQGIRQLEAALANPVDKDKISASSSGIRQLFTKSVVAADNFPAGAVLTRQMITFKKPGDGIPAAEYQRVLGRTLRHAVVKDQAITLADLRVE